MRSQTGVTALRSVRVVTAVVFLIGLAGVQIASKGAGGTASAEVYQCGTKSNYFDGKVDQTSANRLGSAATISDRYGAVCDTNTSRNNFVVTWAMITPALSGEGWAQSGYERWYNHCTVFFAQDSPDGSVTGNFTGMTCQPNGGETNVFTEDYDGGCSCILEQQNGRTLRSTNFDPTVWWSTPWHSQFLGEAAYLASDMPGHSASPTDFTSLKYKDSSGWHDYLCGVLTAVNEGKAERADGQAWYDTTTTCPSFKIYTDTAGN